MTCKPESQKQRLERIAVQILAGVAGNPEMHSIKKSHIEGAIAAARELMKQVDELPPIE